MSILYFISYQMLCSSQWYHHSSSPKIPCIALPSLQTSSRLQFLPIPRGGLGYETELIIRFNCSTFVHAVSFHSLSHLPALCSTLSSRFVTPQTGSSSRYMGQQNSPVPSPYTPQSPATGYIQQYPHQQPPSYNQHQQIQQGESVCCLFMCVHEETHCETGISASFFVSAFG